MAKHYVENIWLSAIYIIHYISAKDDKCNSAIVCSQILGLSVVTHAVMYIHVVAKHMRMAVKSIFT